MPIYTYHCSKCKKTVDRKSSMAERDNPEPCECGYELTREEIAETANMKVNWAYWQVPFDDA